MCGLALACGGDASRAPQSGQSASQSASTTRPESTGSATAIATGSAASAIANGSAKARIVMMGTSLTAGYGLDPDESYVSLLQRKADSAGLRLELVNAGLSGETSAGALRRIDWVLQQPASAVVLEVGANDGLRGADTDSLRANLESLVRIVRQKQPNARVLLVQMEAPTNLGRDYVTRFHTAYADAAKSSGVELLPFLLDRVAGISTLNQGDGIHPNVKGSRIVADNMWKSLLPLFTEVARSPLDTSKPVAK